jgi:hypothetical protein
MTFLYAILYIQDFLKPEKTGDGPGAEIFDKLEPELHENGPAPKHCGTSRLGLVQNLSYLRYRLPIDNLPHHIWRCFVTEAMRMY